MNRGTRVGRIGWMAMGCLLCVTMLEAQQVSFSPPAGTFTESINVQLSGAGPNELIRYVVASGPNAVEAVVTADSPVYNGPLTLTSTSLVRAAVFSANGEAGRVTGGHYVLVGESARAFRSAMPIVVLDVLGAGGLEKDEVNHAAWLFGFEPSASGNALAGPAAFSTPMVASVRGSSSAGFPKKGYNVRMRDAAARARAFPLFDLPAYERWAFVAPWGFDSGFINNAFMYELSNRIGRWAPRTKLVEMFYNAGGDDLDFGDYGGVYVVTDRIRAEPGRVDIPRLSRGDDADPAITGGYIFQFDPPEPGDVKWETSRGVPDPGPSEIVLVEPGADDVTPAQLDYLQGYLQRMEDALHADLASGFQQRTYLEYIDRGSWIDHHILNVLANNPDALHRSAYFTKPRNGRLQAGPVWDFDRALGGFWDERDRESLVNTWSGINGVVDVWQSGWWGVLAQDPDFVQDWVDRWQSLRRADFATPALGSLVQQLADQVGVEAANRDYARWPDSASPYGSFSAQTQFLKDWLGRRAAWIDSQFVAPPIASASNGTVSFTPPDGAVVAYTLDGTDPRASGGGLAARVQLHSGTLTVPAGANIRVRSYDSAPRQQFPSSPWSSLADAIQIAPSASQGRIVNLSSQAMLSGPDAAVMLGFAVRDAASKSVLVRAVGPGLASFGVEAAARQPELVLTSGADTVLARNAGWNQDAQPGRLAEAAQRAGAFPLAAGNADAAAVVDVPAGNYSVQITTSDQGGGMVLAEIYELETSGRLANVSILGHTSEDAPLAAGFVVAGGPNRVLIRAVGPSLGNLGVSNAVADPVITVRSGGSVLASNRSWLAGGNAIAVAESGAQVGAFPLDAGSQDAAVVLNLPPGAYTVEAGAVAGRGSLLLEIYDVP